MYDIYEKLLEIKGVTTADVCKATGISQSTMSNWKKRQNNLSAKNAQKVADYFGVSVDYLMSGRERPEPQETYHFDPEAAEITQEVLRRPELRALFKATRGVKSDNVLFAANMLEKFKETNPDG